ncbi:KH domain RNA binding protein YlqC [hydrothermal vent metagenome]|uniref:KH domain RNA binding protein YlqC n=1 Tax=hydrothermal vent metagenome TaxID=652676 RepID=A0A3B1BUI3_9ZZZZ|nr:KH domain-containing protein [Nitrospirota bacterium]
MKALLEHMVIELVDNPDQIKIEEMTGDKVTTLELRVAPEDLGKVIGRRGRTAGAMRLILSAAATKEQKRAVLEILD